VCASLRDASVTTSGAVDGFAASATGSGLVSTPLAPLAGSTEELVDDAYSDSASDTSAMSAETYEPVSS
jgi:hypothetical protein